MNEPWYCRNSDIHRDLGMDDVTEEIQNYAQKHGTRLHHHVNVEAIQLLDNDNQRRRLKRTKPLEPV